MKCKPIKRPQKELEAIPKFEQQNRKLQIQIDGLKNKILKLENKTLKQEQQIIKLKSENAILKESRRPLSINISGLNDPDLKKAAEEINKKNR